MQPLMTHLEAAGGDVKVGIRLHELGRVNSVNLLNSESGGAAVVGIAGFDLQVLHSGATDSESRVDGTSWLEYHHRSSLGRSLSRSLRTRTTFLCNCFENSGSS